MTEFIEYIEPWGLPFLSFVVLAVAFYNYCATKAHSEKFKELTYEELNEIKGEALFGNKAEAMKLFRKYTGCGLKEADEFVEKILRSNK